MSYTKLRHHFHPATRVGRPFTPAEVAALYDFPAAPGVTPQVIALIELGGGYQQTDMAAAFAAWNLPLPIITEVSVNGAKNSPGSDADGEVVLDGQVAAAAWSACTGSPAKLLYVWAPNDGGASFAAAILAAVRNGASVISISWGGPEDQWSTADIQAMEAAIATAIGAGVPVFAASGDNDSGDGQSGAHVDYPASSPGAIGCGGTTLTATGSQIASEVVWNSGAGEGTGGGYSGQFARPVWQAKANTARGVPDVAGDADPATGYQIFLNGQLTVVGGTSAVAPLWAALAAVLKGAAAAQGRGLPSPLHPLLYGNANAFRDIVTGNNGQYAASVGWDPTTGLGTPRGKALLAAVLGTAGPVPVPTPTPPPVPVPTPTPTPVPPGLSLLFSRHITRVVPKGATLVFPSVPATIPVGQVSVYETTAGTHEVIIAEEYIA